MSKFRSGFAIFIFAALLSGAMAYAAEAKGGGGGKGGGGHSAGRGGGFHAGGGGARHAAARPSAGRSVARQGFRSNRSFAVRNAPARSSAAPNAGLNSGRDVARNSSAIAASSARMTKLNANAVGNALNSRQINRALSSKAALHDPRTRALVTASVATAAWHGGRNGWWGHRNGGFGWVGPVFWPFAFYDIYDYALWGYGYDAAFWGYGYPDIYAGIFTPYGYDDLAGYTGYLPGYADRSGSGRDSFASANPNDRMSLAQMCGEDSRDIAGLPIDVFQRAIQPNDAQRAALDDLANASAKAAQDIKAACPTDIALTAPRRLAVMQQRVEAMIAAVGIVQPPLEQFYNLLNDEQKAQLNALAAAQRPTPTAEKMAGPTDQSCAAAQPGLTEWPGAVIDQTVVPTDAQRKGLTALQDAAFNAANILRGVCQPDNALTPPARLAAVGKRLDTMLQAVKTVRAAMDDFYGSLSDEQKANFDAIGPQRTGAFEEQRGRGRRSGNVEHVIRRLMSFAR